MNKKIQWANTIINKYLDYTELVVYDNAFVCNYEHLENY